MMAFLQLHGRLHHLVEHAVDAEADAELLLVGLDVDVGGPLLDGVEQDQVHQLDDRRLGGAVLEVDGVEVVVAALDERHLGVVEAHHDLVEVGPLLGVEAIEGLADGLLRGHHHVDVVAGEELDVVDGEDVGRVAHGDDQRRAGAVDRHHQVLLGGGLGHQLEHLRIDLEVLEVDGGDAVLLGEEAGQVRLGDGALLHQQGADAAAALARFLLRLLELLEGDEVLTNQQFAEPSGHVSCSPLFWKV